MMTDLQILLLRMRVDGWTQAVELGWQAGITDICDVERGFLTVCKS